MARTYFELEDDLCYENRWHLAGLFDRNGTELDAREFTYGKPLDVGPPLRTFLWNEDEIVEAQAPLRVDLHSDGVSLDFTYTTDNMPVVTSTVADIFSRFAGSHIQRLPVWIVGSSHKYEIINVISRVNCIDWEKSEIELWQKGNKVRPDLAGKPHVIRKLLIDPSAVDHHQHVFRLQDWEISIIVSEEVKEAFDAVRVSGVNFRLVST